MEQERVCPLMSIGLVNISLDVYPAKCLKGKCQFWTRAYTTESLEYYDCALVIGALKDSDGRIPV